MPVSKRNGVEIYYEVAGRGPPLVMLHAIPFDHRLWTYQVMRFSTWFRCIAVDLRCWGRSAKVREPFTFRDMADDIIGVMGDEGAREGIVMGCSVGSKLALMLGVDDPARFRGVIMVGGNSGPQLQFEHRIKGYREEPLPAYRKAHLEFGVSKHFAKSTFGQYLLESFMDATEGLDGRAIGRVFEAMSVADVQPKLAMFKTPSLVVNGEFDSALPRGAETAKMIPGARHVVLKNAGHACMVEDPEAFDAAVIAFLRDHRLMPANPS
ncbi:MAG TPA: alpha/beta hydrolase [Alphaproteobacteria bacterium]|nr:alpha/beta hydrolase [Alphaproteobacteria bacterium]